MSIEYFLFQSNKTYGFDTLIFSIFYTLNQAIYKINLDGDLLRKNKKKIGGKSYGKSDGQNLLWILMNNLIVNFVI